MHAHYNTNLCNLRLSLLYIQRYRWPSHVQDDFQLVVPLHQSYEVAHLNKINVHTTYIIIILWRRSIYGIHESSVTPLNVQTVSFEANLFLDEHSTSISELSEHIIHN